jgi:hypothetical protein
MRAAARELPKPRECAASARGITSILRAGRR